MPSDSADAYRGQVPRALAQRHREDRRLPKGRVRVRDEQRLRGQAEPGQVQTLQEGVEHLERKIHRVCPNFGPT